MAGSMERWVGKVAIVTGASSGIGYEIAKHLVDAGVKVVGVARRKEKLDDLKNQTKGKHGELHPFSADISKENDILALFKWTKDNLGPVHILVNNAGVLRQTTLIEGDTTLWKEVLDTNVLGLCMATREAVKDMRANDVDGHIIHINSIVGHFITNIPELNVYPASKFAVTALTETIRNELNLVQSKIKISSISPGLVKTEVFDAMIYRNTNEPIPEVSKNEIFSIPHLKAEDVANTVMFVLSTPPHVQVHEVIMRAVLNPY